jgi:inner membrane protein
VAQASSDAMAWVGEFSIAADVPATLAERYCAVDALMQFARVPWAAPRDDGWVVGDLRYDREPELGFAEIEVGPTTDDCRHLRPPWVPPRQDLLNDR